VPDKTILIVDADVASLNFLVRLEKEQGYFTVAADSGKEGLIVAWRDRPDLIIFDPALPDISPEEFLLKLRRDLRSTNIPILAVSSSHNPGTRESCLHAGCNEYMLKTGELVTTLPKVITRLLGGTKELVKDKEGGHLIVFLSAKGGTGTSSLCANFAMAIHHNKPEANVAVVDLVLPIGSIAPIVGYQGDLDLVSISEMSSAETAGDYFHKSLPFIELWQFRLVAGAPDPERSNDLKVARIPEVINALQKAYDYIVVDLGRSLSRISLPIIQIADIAVLVMSTDQSTITLTKKILDYLHAQGIESRNIYAILNRAVGLEGLTKAEAEKIIGLPIKTAIPYMGGNFALANNLNQPIILKYPEDTASIVFRDVANDMIKTATNLRNG
jgi:MinD-like ATPase involved in chromosome partitioning or flagellar assembly/ActR/RegA family two-component response regulator